MSFVCSRILLVIDAHVMDLANSATGVHIVLTVAVLVFLSAVCLILTCIQRAVRKAIARERERLALEIHDTLAQSFAGIAFQLQVVRDEIPDGSPLRKQVQTALAMVRRSHDEARRTMAMLHSSFSGRKVDLAASLRQSAERLVPDGLLTVHSSLHGQQRRIPAAVADTLFLIGQEAIHNSVRHAHPHQIEICLDVGEDTAQLSVRDDGCGFVVDDARSGFGLVGMGRRAEAASAHLQVLSAPGMGTAIVATVPISPLRRAPLRARAISRQFFGRRA